MRLERDGEFWEIELDDRTITTRTGRIGTRGKATVATHASPDEAARAHDDAIVDALRREFYEPPGKPPPPPGLDIRDAVLEQALREHRERDAYLVYADWLQTHGNPIGELVAASIRLEAGRDVRIAKRVDALRTALRLPLPNRARFTWRHGLWGSLQIENKYDPPDRGPSYDILVFARELFEHVACAALHELVLGYMGYLVRNDDFMPRMIEDAGRQPWARSLPRLHLSAAECGSVGAAISAAFPELEHLRVNAGIVQRRASTSLAGLALPQLETLVLDAVGYVDTRLADLPSFQLPKVERLELHLGPTAATGALDDVFARRVFPAVRHLALRQAANGDSLVAQLCTTPLAARLESLDVSNGTLGDDGARAMLLAPTTLRNLQTLVIDRCYVSQELVRALEARFKRVSAVEQRPSGTERYRRSVAYDYPPTLPRRRR